MVAPLRKQSDGKVYSRPPEIEAALELLTRLPIEEVAVRAQISDAENRDYVPSECLLHFVRQSKANGDGKPYQELFTTLRIRVIRSVSVWLRRVAGVPKTLESDLAEQIQEMVLFDFQKLLCLDRQDYDPRLNFYEIRFNRVIALLRASAWRAILKKQSRRKPMEYDGDGAELTMEMEEALARVRNPNRSENDDSAYRLRFYEAISTLPDDDRRVMELLLNGLQHEAIAKILGCVEKTVRNRRDRAFAAIRLAMKEEYVA